VEVNAFGLGGGGQAPEATPVSPESLPIIRERFPQTLYWNPQAVTGEDGRLTVDIPTGDAITTWRINALAVDRSGNLGSATAPLVVFQPLFLVPQLPDTLDLGQETYAPVLIFNYSAQPLAVTLVAQATPGLAVEAPQGVVEVPANEVVAVPLRLQGVAQGEQTLILAVQSNGTDDARQVTILVQDNG
jgi:hypothetical protein